MTGLLVDVQLEVLVIVHEAPPGLVHGQVQRVRLVEEVGVLTVTHGGLHLDHLAAHLIPDGVDVGELALAASLSQPRLHCPRCGLEIVVGDLKISKVGKCRVLWQWSVHSELDLLGVGIQTVSNVHSDLQSDGRDESVDLILKVRAVVDDVDVGMTDPGLGGEPVPVPGLVQGL